MLIRDLFNQIGKIFFIAVFLELIELVDDYNRFPGMKLSYER